MNDYEYEWNPGNGADPEPEQVRKPVKAKKNRGIGKAIVALCLCCALLGGAVGAGSVLFVRDGVSAVNETQPSAPALQQTASQEPASISVSARDTNPVTAVTKENGQLMTASEVYAKNVNSTVGITTEITTTNYWGVQSTGAAAGSGFILTSDGYILTNQHVIDSANTITVAMYDGTTYEAKLIGADAGNDIAVLKIDAEGLTPVTLGDSDALLVGEDVLAIGNPLGELTFSLTRGAVSALDRTVTMSSGVTMNLIQTDCAINSGNSGGALFNLYGEVVGITNAKYSSNSYSNEASIDNIGFAIPINQVRDIVTSIIEKGYISKPYIGVTVSDVSEESQSYGAPKGAAIRSVEAGSPAEQAGLQAGDIVTAIDGNTITSYRDLSNAIAEGGVGTVLQMTVYRQGETQQLTVTVGEKQQSALPEEQTESEPQQSGNPGEGNLPWGGEGEGGFPWGGSDGQSGGWPFGG
ncbi:MAG: trypsin-like peptidase domain-containing protein [Oscillospiraceae bacterium]|nr:trypsin-like peptidase domain-containing protein [Oscillospiraceae bacterium]